MKKSPIEKNSIGDFLHVALKYRNDAISTNVA